MKNILIKPLKQPIQREITVPGSVSYTIRALALAAMTKGRVKIINPSKCDDVGTMVDILRKLGIEIKEKNNCISVEGDISRIKNRLYELNADISGRTARTALALLSIVPGEKLLNCKEEFKKRPIGDLVDGLRQLGAKIDFLEEDGFLPVRIISDKLKPGIVRIKGSISSQFISAILMVAPQSGDITVEVIGDLTSKPFVDMTIDVMKEFGVRVINEKYSKFRIYQGQKYSCDRYLAEGDATAASYFWAIAAITRSKIRVKNINPTGVQGDIVFADILGKMGCNVRKNKSRKWIEVEGTKRLQSIDVDLNSNPDIAQTLAVVGAFSSGKTIMRGINNLKFKETDRIEAPKNELKKMGIKVKSTKNSLQVIGGKAHGAEIQTYGDHRMAMSFAVAGAKIDGIKIINPDVVNKSFPDFWQKLQSLGIGILKEEG